VLTQGKHNEVRKPSTRNGKGGKLEMYLKGIILGE
jgi:hypothetical protein